MQLTLRSRIVLLLLPIFLLLAAVGGGGVVLLHRVSDRIDAILRENYRSVNYMERLNEALERIDSSFNFAIVGREDLARPQYESNWKIYDENLSLEKGNITLADERELVDRLNDLTEQYRRRGAAFYELPATSPARVRAYHDPGGQFDLFKQIKNSAAEIRRINQQNMEQAGAAAQRTAAYSITALGIGMFVAAIAAGLLGWNMMRSVLQPIQAVTESAREISAGNLDQIMPVLSADEIGALAEAFNLMARHLREYRRSQVDQLLRAQQTSQATIDSFPDPVLVIDVEGRVEMANPAARRLLGVIPTAQGRGLATWQPPESLRGPLSEALLGRRNYLPESFDHAISMSCNGDECVVLPRILTIRDSSDHTLGAAILLQDVTRLRLLDQVKSNLVATASHELKTPLTGIRLAVHLLLEESVGPLTPKQLELLLDARDNSERLLSVVNNLLDLARLEQGSRQLDIRLESPRALLQSAAEAARGRADDKDIEIVLNVSPGLPSIPVDVERMGHALGNLVGNAVTYSDRGGRITLTAEERDGRIALTVGDNGPGIPAEHLPHIFEKFFRVPGRTRDAGTGLGLAIVQEIVNSHGGAVTCESRLGEGTTFTIQLPKSTGYEAAVSSPEQRDDESPESN